MPRSSKNFRGEVKPSKFKTSLCQFYLKGEVCPFSEKCAFAHGDSELRSEQQNLEEIQFVRSQAPPASAKRCAGESVADQHDAEISKVPLDSTMESPQLNPCGERASALNDSSSGTTPASDCATPPSPPALHTPRSDAGLNFSHGSGCISPNNSTSTATLVFRHNPYSTSGRTVASPVNAATSKLRRTSVASSNSSS